MEELHEQDGMVNSNSQFPGLPLQGLPIDRCIGESVICW